MTWTSRTLIDGHDSILYVQVAGVTAAPGTGDEVGFVSNFDFSFEPDVGERGPFINSSTIKKTINSYSASGSLTIEIAGGTDAAREVFFTAMANKTRVKLTVQMDPTTGVKEVFDQCVVGVNGTIAPGEGGTYEISFDSDSYTHTAASG